VQGGEQGGAWADKYFDFLLRRQKIIHVILIVITALSVYAASKLQLKTNFSELLPQQLPSVQQLKVATERLGGTGLLLIGVESPNYAANRKFVEELAKRLQPWEGKTLRYIEYRYTDIRDYIEKYALHFLPLEKLEKINKDLIGEIEKKKDKTVGDFLGLSDEPMPEEDASLKTKEDTIDLSEIDPTLKRFMSYRDSYLSADDGQLMVVALRPMNSSLNVADGERLVREVGQIITELNPSSYDSAMKIGLSGNVPQAVDEFNTVKQDIKGTAILLTALIVAVLFLFFWSAKVIILLMANLLLAVAWTFGATYLVIGYLNTQTAFLGSLVVGTGINYGIILVSRYLELRSDGVSLRDSVVASIRNVAIPTFIATSTTAVSFVALLTASNKGFSQFGFIGGIGVMFCWIAAMSLLPLWLYMLEKKFPMKVGHDHSHPIAEWLLPVGQRLGSLIVQRAKLIGIAVGIAVLVCVPGVVKLVNDPIEYNFNNLRNKITVSPEVAQFRTRVQNVFSTSLAPSLVLVETADEARALCPSVKARKSQLSEDKDVIHSCMSLFELVPKFPEDAAQQHLLFKDIHKNLAHPLLKYADNAEFFKHLHNQMSFTPPKFDDIPQSIVRRYTELNGQTGLFGIVNPENSKPLEDGRNLLAYTESLTNVPFAGSTKTFSATGDSFVLADLLRNIRVEGPKVAAIAFLGVVIIAVFLSGGFWAGMFMTACLAVGTFFMLGIQGFLGLKYNFFNFIALPLTFGIGVDYPINVFIRCKQESYKNYGRIFVTTGMAVLLCALTTIIGYYTLIPASSQALASFGKIAIIGEITCLFVAIIGVPVGLTWARKMQARNEVQTTEEKLAPL
jgi:predicted RND superfamily exporter protein